METLCNEVVGYLFSSINDTTTTIEVTNSTQSGFNVFPNNGSDPITYRVRIDDEIIKVRYANRQFATTVLTVDRGQEGSTAASHSSGAPVHPVLTVAALKAHSVDYTPAFLECRLSVSSNNPIGSGFGTTLYLHPYNGNRVALWDSSLADFVVHHLTSPISKSITSPGGFFVRDVFLKYASGALDLDFTDWDVNNVAVSNLTTGLNPTLTTATAHGLSVGDVFGLRALNSSTHPMNNNLWIVNTVPTTTTLTIYGINNVTTFTGAGLIDKIGTRTTNPLNTGNGAYISNSAGYRYLGTIFIVPNRSTGTYGVYENPEINCVWNVSNRLNRDMSVSISDSHTVTTGTSWKYWNNLMPYSDTTSLIFVAGLAEEASIVAGNFQLQAGTNALVEGGISFTESGALMQSIEGYRNYASAFAVYRHVAFLYKYKLGINMLSPIERATTANGTVIYNRIGTIFRG